MYILLIKQETQGRLAAQHVLKEFATQSELEQALEGYASFDKLTVYKGERLRPEKKITFHSSENYSQQWDR